MRSGLIARNIGIVVVLTLVSIALHEFGHFLVYKAAGVPVWISLQSVRPVGKVPAWLDPWAKIAGPIFSWIAALVCIVIAGRRPSFAWSTAALTNASIRLFPAVMDLVRAVNGAHPFSDEGDVALAMTRSPAGRAGLVSVAIVLSLALSVAAARRFRFEGRGALKSLGVYLLSLAVGIAIVILDELLRQKMAA